MAEWEGQYYKHVGFKFGDLEKAAREQHTPETCWAAALAISSVLLGKMAWNNEIKWYNTASRSGLVMKNSTRILKENLETLIKGIPGFRVKAYTIPQLAGVIGDSLKNDRVILLMAEEHVVILGQLQLEKGNNSLTYHVIDSADGRVQIWSQAKFNLFKPVYAAVMST